MKYSQGIIELLDYPGYGVSSDGQVFCRRPFGGKGKHLDLWRPVKPLLCSNRRYLQVGINRKKILVHKLIAETFIGPRPKGCEIAHRNGNSHENAAQNLCYLTHRDNEAMKVQHGTSLRGEKNPFAVLSKRQVVEIKIALKNQIAGRILSQKYHVCEAVISQIKHNKRWGWLII